MRKGQNPAKFVEEVAKPADVTVVIATFIPFQAGYFADSLEVLRLCLESLRQSTARAYDLLVFDNGSAPEVVSFLKEWHDRDWIDYLVLSGKNLGKGGAWDVAFPAAPGKIIAYADADVLFLPGWLDQAMALLDTFPGVGMVSCRPLRTDPELTSATLSWAESDPEATVERGNFIPWETFREHDLNLGQAEAAVRSRFETTEDVRVTYHGVKALAGAVHWQFVTRKSVLEPMLPLSLERPMGQVRALDGRLNQAGFLRLMTTEPYVRHLGNAVPEDLARHPLPAPRKTGRSPGRLLRWGPLRRLLLAVHHQIFRWYFGS